MRRVSALWMAVGLMACAGETPLPEADASADADSTAVDSAAVTAEAFEPDPLPSLPGEGEPRVYRLRLVNSLELAVLVFASADAARVVLDTVPPVDSVHVDVRVRADVVELEAEDERGRPLSASTLDLSSSDLNRWVIVDPSGSSE